MLFLVFSERPCTRLWSSFLIKMLQLLSSFAHTASVLIHVHQYQISIHWFWNFDPLLILNLLRRIIPRKQKNERKIVNQSIKLFYVTRNYIIKFKWRPKNFEGQNFFLTKFTECLGTSTRQKLCRVYLGLCRVR